MSEPRNNELESIFDAVEHPEGNSRENSPDCEELSEITDRYEKIKLLGEGGLKKVWKACDHCSHREIAYAEPQDGLHPLFYDLLLEEAWLTASLQHPNIIKVHDVGITEDKKPFFTMDLKQGKSLTQWKNESKGPNLDLEQCLDIFIKVCEAVEHAHSQGILHLDLKPDNIQLESFDEVVVCDWGLARRTEDTLAASAKEVAELAEMSERSLGGTPGFMAPEQTEKNETLTYSTDIYGLGALLYFLISGKSHVEGNNISELIQSTKKGNIVNISKYASSIKIPTALHQIMSKCLQLRPENRYRKITLLIEDIRVFRRLNPTSFQKKQPLTCAWLFYRRQQLLCNATTVFSLIFIFGVWWFSSIINQETLQRKQQEKRAAQAEQKADFALNEIHRIEEDILKIEQEGIQDKIAKADELNEIVSGIKKKNMYDKTTETVQAMELLSNLSLSLDPNSHMAWHQLAEVAFIRLNTKRTKEILQHYKPTEHRLLEVFEQVPTLSFNQENPPSQDELIQFIKQVEWQGLAHILIQRVILYHYENKRHDEDYEKVIRSYFIESSKGHGDLKFQYNSKRRHITLTGYKYNSQSLMPRLYTLKCLPIRNLTLKGDFLTFLGGFSHLETPYIDLSQLTSSLDRLDRLHLNESVKELTLKKGMYSKSILEKLKSSFTVIEVE